jgi:hypothetical protein
LQLDWVKDVATDLLDAAARAESIEAAKFSAPLLPRDRFRIQVRVGAADRIEFRIWNGGTEYARGHARIASRSPGS